LVVNLNVVFAHPRVAAVEVACADADADAFAVLFFDFAVFFGRIHIFSEPVPEAEERYKTLPSRSRNMFHGA
jgi:hypothetical protein